MAVPTLAKMFFSKRNFIRTEPAWNHPGSFSQKDALRITSRSRRPARRSLPSRPRWIIPPVLKPTKVSGHRHLSNHHPEAAGSCSSRPARDTHPGSSTASCPGADDHLPSAALPAPIEIKNSINLLPSARRTPPRRNRAGGVRAGTRSGHHHLQPIPHLQPSQRSAWCDSSRYRATLNKRSW